MSTSAPRRHRRFTTEEYFRMAETGILTDDDRVELIDGDVLEMTPIGERHAGAVNRLIQLFGPVVAGRAILCVQNPLRLSDVSTPQPDVTIARIRDDCYATMHPRPADVLLLVEVADSSVAMDLGRKARLYAAAGIPEYWVLDLTRDEIVVHTDPVLDGYEDVRVVGRAGMVSPRSFPGVEWGAEEILGSAS